MQGESGEDGQSVIVTDNGNGTYTITGANGNIVVSDGNDGNAAPIPILIDNGDGTYTISNGVGQTLTFSDGDTPQLGIDYFVAGGNYVSLIYRNEGTRPNTPTGGSFNGSSETFPSGWTDNPTDYTPPSKRWVSTRQYQRNASTGVWSATGVWSTPSLQAENGETGETGITATIETPLGTQWKRDSSGNYTPTSGSNIPTNLPMTARFFKNGVEVATGTRTALVNTTVNKVTFVDGVLDTGVTQGQTAYEATRTFTFTYQGVTVGKDFSVIFDGVDGEMGPPGVDAPGVESIIDTTATFVQNSAVEQTVFEITNIPSGTWEIEASLSGTIMGIDSIMLAPGEPDIVSRATRIRAYIVRNGSILSVSNQYDPSSATFTFDTVYDFTWTIPNLAGQAAFQLRIDIDINGTWTGISVGGTGFLRAVKTA